MEVKIQKNIIPKKFFRFKQRDRKCLARGARHWLAIDCPGPGQPPPGDGPSSWPDDGREAAQQATIRVRFPSNLHQILQRGNARIPGFLSKMNLFENNSPLGYAR